MKDIEQKIDQVLEDEICCGGDYCSGTAEHEADVKKIVLKLFTEESKAYLMELIGPDEAEEVSWEGTEDNSTYPGGKYVLKEFPAGKARNQLRAELREKISGK